MNNITAIKAMASWTNLNGRTPAPDNYIDLYLDKVGLENVVDDESNYDAVDQVLQYTEEDMLEEIAVMDAVNDYFQSEDVENIEDWDIKPQQLWNDEC